MKSFKLKVTNIISKNKTSTQDVLIGQLNPVIRGWANYHRHIIAKYTFKLVDNFLFNSLWRWAKRRHSRKSAHWVRNKYFQTHKNFNWTFRCRKTSLTLFQAQSVTIKRHIKIKGIANPYDPLWDTYFEKRKRPRNNEARR